MEERERQVLNPKKDDVMNLSKPSDAATAPSAKVIEVVTFKLRGGVTAAQLRLVDQDSTIRMKRYDR